jgi:E3 ubiquitin-protein ligase HUWE1
MLENDIDGIFELTYSVEADDFGSTSIVDLKPGGQEIPVTNKKQSRIRSTTRPKSTDRLDLRADRCLQEGI